MNKKAFATIISFTLVFSIVFSAFTAVTQAQTSNPKDNAPATYTLLEPLPCLDSGSKAGCEPGKQITRIQFKDYVRYAFNLMIALSGVAAVFMIVLGGFQYMSSDAYSGKKEGLTRLQNAIYGLLLVLCSYLILRTIDPRLVDIPTTLVKPLDITYKPNELAKFFQQLQDDASQFRSTNMAILDNNNEIQKQIDAKVAERKSLCDQLSLEFGYGQEPGISCNDLILKSGSMDLSVQDIARRAQDLGNQQMDLETKRDTNMAIGLMNVQIQRCYAVKTNADPTSKINVSDCTGAIELIGNSVSQRLRGSGSTVEAEKVRNYAAYATAITEINTTILKNMSSSPYAKALVDSTQSALSIAGTAAGSALGPLGAIGGFAAAQVPNAGINYLVVSSNNKAAELTVSQIQLGINEARKTITDEQIFKKFEEQSHSLIKQLGGKGDGSDSTKMAEERKELLNSTDNTSDTPWQ